MTNVKSMKMLKSGVLKTIRTYKNKLFTNLNVTCAMHVTLALHDGTYINAWTNMDTPLLLLASIFATNTLRHRKISLRILPSSKNATASLTASSMRCSSLTNWDQVSMYNVTQFVRKFLNSFLFILFLYVLIVFHTPLFNIFMLFTFVTSLFYYIISTYVNFYLHFAW